MDAAEWIGAFAGELGQPAPNEEQIAQILKLAAVAAHSSERIAAPVATYLAGVTGRPLDELIALAEELSSDS